MNKEEITVFNLIKESNKGRVIELCPGFGNLAEELKSTGFRVFTADIEPSNLQKKDIPIIKADMNKQLPFKDSSADYIICLGSIEHLETQYNFTKEIKRVLKNSGKFLLSTPNILNLASRLRYLLTGFYSLAERPCPENNKKNYFIEHIYPLTYYQLRHMIHTAGLKITKLTSDRKRKSCIFLLWLYPLILFITYIALIKEPDPRQKEINKMILKDLLSLTILTGRNLIIEAEKNENSRYRFI
ncbi:MAG: class I SAM-dependent methyltransferase [Candidatus Hydrogenedentota bacterium]